MVLVRNIIFNKDEVWDNMPLQCTANKIKKLDKIIPIIELPKIDKLEDI